MVAATKDALYPDGQGDWAEGNGKCTAVWKGEKLLWADAPMT